MPKILITVLFVAILAVGGYFFYLHYYGPDVTPSPSASPSGEANIIVTSPKSGDSVGNPITVTGSARTFEQTFAYALKDTQGNKLYENFGMTHAPDLGVFGEFTVKIPVPLNAPKELVVEVFEYSAMDGSVINLVQVPVTLNTTETMTLKAYFSNSKLDTTATCNRVFPVNRTVVKTQETAYISLTEMLEGVTTAERNAGYSSNLPENVRINSIVISNGTATVDFNETLEAGVAGSCRVTAIRAQITQTLMQFSSVKNVVISINGRTEDILQP